MALVQPVLRPVINKNVVMVKDAMPKSMSAMYKSSKEATSPTKYMTVEKGSK